MKIFLDTPKLYVNSYALLQGENVMAGIEWRGAACLGASLVLGYWEIMRKFKWNWHLSHYDEFFFNIYMRVNIALKVINAFKNWVYKSLLIKLIPIHMQ